MSGYGFKAQLKEALASAVGYFQDGGDPNDACVKAANEAGFNADQADRLVETFNTARVICNYKSADDKTSSCSLADKETVRSKLTAPVKEAERNFSEFDYGCYKKAEVDHIIVQKKEAEFEVHEDGLSKEAEDWLRIRKETTIRELAKEAEEQARGLRSMADEIAEKVAMQLSRNVTLSDVHDKMARLVHAYATDDRYAPGVEKVAEFLPVASDPHDISHLLKYAKAHVVDTSDLSDVLPAIKEASDFVAEAAALEAYSLEMGKEAQALQPSNADLETDDKDKLENLLLKERIMGERAKRQEAGIPAPKLSLGGGHSGPVNHDTRNSLIAYLRDSWKANSDAESAARVSKATDGVNNVRRQLILQNLLATDKVLSQEDPNSVAEAYRSIHQVSPDTTLNKEVLRSMLRSVVQSVAISPYDAKTLVDLDKTRRQAYDPKMQAVGKEAK